MRLLVDHREDLVAERTRVINRLRWHLHELDPDGARPRGPCAAQDDIALTARLGGHGRDWWPASPPN